MQTFAIGLHHTQGDALGYALVAPSGRAFIATLCPGLCACWAFSPLLKRLSATRNTGNIADGKRLHY